MAAIATFCSTNHSSGIKKLNDYLLNKHSTTRTHPVFSIPDSRQRLLCCNGSNKNTHTRQLKSKPNHLRLGNLLKHRAVNDNVVAEEEKKEDISQATLLWRAVKLPIYSVALVPLTVGSAAAYLQTGLHCARRYLMLLASSVLIITWLNLSNDVYDFDTGADKNKKESVVNIVGSIWITVGSVCLVLFYKVVQGRSLLLAYYLFLVLSALLGYLWRLEVCIPYYYSLLQLFVATYTSELTINGTVISASLLVGFTTSLILFCSHFHQIKEDKAVGKISPLVRLGTEAGSKVVKLAVVTIYSLLFVLGLGQTLPFSSVILCSLTVPMGNSVVSYVEENHKDKTKIFMAKYYCVRLHTLFGAALAAGMVAARIFARKQLPYSVIL